MKISQEVIERFLNDVRLNSTTEIFETSAISEKDEIYKVAKSRGIDLKDNKDLAGYKNIYALTDSANLNGAILPKEVVEDRIHTIVGKAVDLEHERDYVVGNYLLGYVEDNKIYTIGIFYRSNFEDEWEEAKRLFSTGELTSSFEIWCPRENREYNEDGTYSLTGDITFAGGALLFKNNPAEPQAKVLSIARKNSKVRNRDLIFANKEDVITSKINEAKFDCECIKCGNKISSEAHCADIKCLKCGGQMRRVDRPGTGNPQSRLKNALFEEIQLPKKFETQLLEKSKNKEGYQIGDIKLENEKILKNIIILNSAILLLDKNLKEMEEIKVGKIKEIIIQDTQKGGQKNMKWEDIKKLLEQGGKESIITKLNEAKFNEEEFEKVAENIIAEVEKEKLAEGKVRAEMAEEKFAVTIKIAKKEGEGVIKLFPIESKEEVEAAFLRFGDEKVQTTLKLLGVNLWEVAKTKFVASLESEIKTKLDTAEAEIKTLKEEAEKKDKELTEAKTKIDELTANLKVKEGEVADEKKKVQFFKENAKKIEATRQELGEFVKDLTDEDLLNEDKVTIAKLQKVNTTLKAGGRTELEQASEEDGNIDCKKVLRARAQFNVQKKLGGKKNG